MADIHDLHQELDIIYSEYARLVSEYRLCDESYQTTISTLQYDRDQDKKAYDKSRIVFYYSCGLFYDLNRIDEDKQKYETSDEKLTLYTNLYDSWQQRQQRLLIESYDKCRRFYDQLIITISNYTSTISDYHICPHCGYAISTSFKF